MSDPEPVEGVPRRRAGAHKAPRGRHRRLVVVGVVLTWGGLALAGYAQLGGQREAAAAVAEEKVGATELQQTVRHIEASWSRGLAADEVGLLRVPRFDKPGSRFVAPIVEGWGDDDLARGVGLYPAGGRPGERGNTVLAGHRVTHGSVFADFPSLQVGDEVEVETASTVVTYRLITSGSQFRVDDTATWPTWPTPFPDADPDRPAKNRYLTLVTCAETFHTDQRNVVVAVQIAERPISRVVVARSSLAR